MAPQTMNEEQTRACEEILQAVLGAKEGRRNLANIFKTLPTREEFPTYYAIIPEPIDLDGIKTRLTNKGFKTPSAFFKDLHLVFLNAKHFNEDTSQIYKDAKVLEDLIHQLYETKITAGQLPPATPIKTQPYKGKSATATAAAKDAPPPAPTPAPAAPAPAKIAPTLKVAARPAKVEPAVEAPPPPVPAPRALPRPPPALPVAAASPAPQSFPAAASPSPALAQAQPVNYDSFGTPQPRPGKPRGRPPKNKVLDPVTNTYVDIVPGMEIPPRPTPRQRGSDSQQPASNFSWSAIAPLPVSSAMQPGWSAPGVGAAGKGTPGDKPTRGPPEAGELIPPEIARTLPLPPLNDPKELPLIEEEERIRAAGDLKLPRWSGPEETLPNDPKGSARPDGEGPAAAHGLGGIRGAGWWGDEQGGRWQPARLEREPGDWRDRAVEICDILSKYRDTKMNRLSKALEAMPEQTNIPFLSFSHPISLNIIAQNAKARGYPTMRAFDMEISRLFEKGRRYHRPGSTPYGHALALQRLYNSLTSSHEPNTYPSRIPGQGPVPNKNSFAAFPAGPGRARVMPDGGRINWETNQFTSFRVATRDRNFTAEARLKGMSYRMGDYVHLINPDDPSRPIIGQVFKTYVATRGAPCHMLSVCWYFRTEQIVHTADRTFYENEIFKSSHFVDHPVEDVLEKVGSQFFTKYVRGRPAPGEWYPGWPLYVCVSRYNERDRICVRIKNWASCIPEELRKNPYTSPVLFEKAPHTLRTFPSPFITGAPSSIGPGATGGLIEGRMQAAPGSPTRQGAEEDEDDRPAKRQRTDGHDVVMDGSSPPKPAPTVNNAVPAAYAPSPIHYAQSPAVSAPTLANPGIPPYSSAFDAESSTAPATGIYPGYPTLPNIPILPALAQSPYASPYQRSPTGYLAPTMLPDSLDASSPAQDPVGPAPASSQMRASALHNQMPILSAVNRGLATQVGGRDRMTLLNEVEELGQPILNYLEKDPASGRVLWFSQPPLDVSVPLQPQHSTEYLIYLAHQQSLSLGKAGSSPAAREDASSQGVNTTLAQARLDPAKILEEMEGLLQSDDTGAGGSLMDSSPHMVSDEDYDSGAPASDWTDDMQAHLVDFLGSISQEAE